ncbi:hypothetical protein F4805DRAFT_475377 [Annulohypoxylon moriforme]|nr:hypothetical protein F4805DRAFT_475377 [Annulohypoxylon moriforme]
MTRPQMIRADTIDLQSQESPSAKKHSTPSPSKTASNANGSLAPHQAETIREVEEDRAGEEGRSPRASWPDGDDRTDLQQYAADLANGIANSLNGNKMQSEDALAIAQNGGVAGTNSDDGDLDTNTDDDLDDDMMDKISSSPSIEDGGCSFPPPVWPQRVDSLFSVVTPRDSSYTPLLSETGPYTIPQHSNHQASKASADASNRRHHLPSEYTEGADRANHGDMDSTVSVNESEERVEDNGFNQFGASVAQSKTYGLSLHRQPSIRAIGLELDAKQRQISPYDFLTPYIIYDDSGAEDDDDDETLLTTDPGFINIGWGGEYLQDLEDIDFEFVYALHTFVATVEGQANATKGDTMVLLDDSNSYWWLVRVVKDSSIGYLPAEHIETPTERLARLNKHRNIDLSATMLGDQAEKTKNPLKTAMKRRKAKTVAFAAPTYVDYSDIDYSTEEEDGDGEKKPQQQDSQKTQQQQEKQASSQQATDDVSEDDESAKVEPLKTRGPQKQVKVEPLKIEERGRSSSVTSSEVRRDSSDIFDAKTERVTRNGTVRNTDSFFKDETIETKKISLTPGLLRDDNEPRASSDSKDSSLRQRPSLEKDLVPDKQKDEKKKKEKKPSAIRSFFSRKERKKSVDEDDDSLGKRSLDASTDTVDKEAEDAHAGDADSSPEKSVAPLRNPGKLQKQPRNDPSPTRKSSVTAQIGADRGPLASETRINNVSTLPPTTLRMVESEQAESQDKPSQKRERSNSKSILSKESKPPKVTKAKARVELDDFDSPDEEEVQPEPTRTPPEPKQQPSEEKPLRPVLPGAFPDSYSAQASVSELSDQTSKTQRPATEERLSESPVEVSPVVSSSNPPALMVDTSSQEDRSSPVSSPSPEFVDIDDRTHEKQDSVTTSTSATTTSTWNDANLRAFFDSVYDKNDVAPAGPDHPVVGTLFREQNARLAEITTQLDNMLGDWLARKQRLRGTV